MTPLFILGRQKIVFRFFLFAIMAIAPPTPHPLRFRNIVWYKMYLQVPIGTYRYVQVPRVYSMMKREMQVCIILSCLSSTEYWCHTICRQPTAIICFIEHFNTQLKFTVHRDENFWEVVFYLVGLFFPTLVLWVTFNQKIS